MTRSSAALTREAVYEILDAVKDPEVPVLSVVELGIVRAVAVEGGSVTVTITPTYSGCPAMHAIEQDVVRALRDAGVEQVAIRTTYTPAWTTDWIPAAAREKLRAYGIAPPGAASSEALVAIGRRRATVCCPRCGSAATQLRSEFGATACKAIHVCTRCREPFEEFKSI